MACHLRGPDHADDGRFEYQNWNCAVSNFARIAGRYPATWTSSSKGRAERHHSTPHPFGEGCSLWPTSIFAWLAGAERAAAADQHRAVAAALRADPENPGRGEDGAQSGDGKSYAPGANASAVAPRGRHPGGPAVGEDVVWVGTLPSEQFYTDLRLR